MILTQQTKISLISGLNANDLFHGDNARSTQQFSWLRNAAKYRYFQSK